jgi:hypothetical protein
MKNNIPTKLKIKTIVMILLISLINTSLFSQIHTENDDCKKPFAIEKSIYQIELGTSTNFQIFNFNKLKTSWTLSGSSKMQKSGLGDKTEEILFDTPGIYYATFTSEASGKIPSHTEKITIEVLPTSFKFDINNVKFSQPLSQGKTVDGITLTIPVEIKSYNKEKVKFGPFRNSSTGVDGTFGRSS